MKGMLIDKGRKNGTFLTGRGEFVKGKHNNRELGEEFEIESSNIDIKKVALVMVLIVAMLGAYIPYNVMATPYGYAEIDINPSVELGYNENFKVIKINDLNNEGKEILMNINVKLKGMQVENAVEEIILYAQSSNYSTENVVVTYTQSGDDDFDRQIEEMICNIDDGFGSVTCVNVAKEEYKELRKQNMEGTENIPPAVHVLRGKIEGIDKQIEQLNENIDISEEKVESLSKRYKYGEIEKVSDLAQIMNQAQKELHELNKEMERQEMEKNKSKNSGQPSNQEKNGNDKGKDESNGKQKESENDEDKINYDNDVTEEENEDENGKTDNINGKNENINNDTDDQGNENGHTEENNNDLTDIKNGNDGNSEGKKGNNGSKGKGN